MSFNRNNTRRPGWLTYLFFVLVLVLCYIYYYNFLHRDCCPQLSLSNKTPYPHLKSTVADHDGSAHNLELVQVQMVSRHGARYPGLSEMQKIRDLYLLTNKGSNVPRRWYKQELVNDQNAAMLSSSGKREMRGIANRVQQRYPQYLTNWASQMQFVSSVFQRSQDSAHEFRAAIDDKNIAPPTTVLPLVNDTILAMKHQCPLWKKQRTEQVAQDVSKETAIFDSRHSLKLLHSAKQRLSIDNLSMKYLAVIYSLCGYDLALYGEENHWCTVLDPGMSKWMELRNDIRYSRVYGSYGPEINQKMACSLFADIWQHMERAVKDKDGAPPIFRFGHSETIMFVNTLVGLDSELGSTSEPISGRMSKIAMGRRGFKSTKLIPFSSNLVFEIYRSKTGGEGFFRLLLNEQPIRYPGCSHEICPISVLQESFTVCDFYSMCKVK